MIGITVATPPQSTGLAAWLRRESTLPERMLWARLRDRGLEGWKFRRQHSVGPYVVDFYCPAARLAVEVDGGIHGEEMHALRDAIRQQAIEATGVVFVRVTAVQVMTNMEGVATMLLEALEPR